MDIAAKIQEIVTKVQSDPKLLEGFQENPTKTVEGLIGIDLPDDQVNAIVAGVKGKITVGNAGDLLGKVGGLFGGNK